MFNDHVCNFSALEKRGCILDAIVQLGVKVTEEVRGEEGAGKRTIFMKLCQVNVMQHLLMQ